MMTLRCAWCGKVLKARRIVVPCHCSCGFTELDQSQVEGEGEIAPRSTAVAPVLHCRNRGEVLRLEPCQTCRGAVSKKVFSCSIHGECVIGKGPAGVHVCDGIRPVDVLILLTAGNPLWDISAKIESLGITADTVSVESNRVDYVRELVTTRKPRLVINRSFCAGWDVVGKLADEFPDTNWVTVNHSSQAHLVTHSHWLTAQNEFLLLARERVNCWYATPDERDYLRRATGIERAIWLPNLVDIPARRDPRPIQSPAVVSLVGRRDVVKNFPAQIIAAGVANRSYPLELLIVTRGKSNDFVRLAESVGVRATVVEWGDQGRYLELIADRVDVGLQASLTESFNYVALDHMGLGIPVVGSPAIRYLPTTWHAQPDDPQSIASLLVEHLQNLDVRQRWARELAEEVAARNSKAFELVIRSLLG